MFTYVVQGSELSFVVAYRRKYYYAHGERITPSPVISAALVAHLQPDRMQDPLSLSLAYECVHGTAPHCLQELVSPYNPPRSLRSSPQCRLIVRGFGENSNKTEALRHKVIPQ